MVSKFAGQYGNLSLSVHFSPKPDTTKMLRETAQGTLPRNVHALHTVLFPGKGCTDNLHFVVTVKYTVSAAE